jgi:integrase
MSAGHIRQRSPGSWEVRYRVDGKVHTRTIKGSKRDAERKLRELLSAADRGEHVERCAVTVAQYVRDRIDQWHASEAIGARSAEQYAVWAATLDQPLGALPLQRLDTTDVEAWHGRLRTRGLSTRTARSCHGLLDRALRDAVRHKLAARNAARDQGYPKGAPAPRAQAPNADQVQALLAKLDDEWRTPVIVALYTGIRRGEMLALKWAAIDLDGAKLQVVEALDETSRGIAFKAPKTEAGQRTIALPAIVVNTLREQRRRQLEIRLLLGLGRPPDDALVFPGPVAGHCRLARFRCAGCGHRPV